MDSEVEGWKLAVARASAYVQSNAAIQIQLFGFYISAVVIGWGVVSNQENRIIMLCFVIPILSFFVLLASCFYFNRLTTQHVYVRVFGHDCDKNASMKSADELWSVLKEKNKGTIFNDVKDLFKSDYTGPYPSFFFIYNLTGCSSLIYGVDGLIRASYSKTLYINKWDSYFGFGHYKIIFNENEFFNEYIIIYYLHNSIFIYSIYYFFAALLSIALTAYLTERAWSALRFERTEKSNRKNLINQPAQ